MVEIIKTKKESDKMCVNESWLVGWLAGYVLFRTNVLKFPAINRHVSTSTPESIKERALKLPHIDLSAGAMILMGANFVVLP